MAYEKLTAHGLNAETFTRAFLDSYLSNGYGVMPKAEIDLLVLQQISEQCEGDVYDIARWLRVSPRKVRAGLDKLAFRHDQDPEELRKRLAKALTEAEVDSDGDGLARVQIPDANLREFAIEIVREHAGIVDWSFNTEVLRLTPQKLFILTFAVQDEENQKQALAAMHEKLEADEKTTTPQDAAQGENKMVAGAATTLKRFANKYVDTVASEAGKATVKGLMAVLTGGASLALDVIPSFTDLVKNVGDIAKWVASLRRKG